MIVSRVIIPLLRTSDPRRYRPRRLPGHRGRPQGRSCPGPADGSVDPGIVCKTDCFAYNNPKTIVPVCKNPLFAYGNFFYAIILPENKFDRAVVGAKDFVVDVGRNDSRCDVLRHEEVVDAPPDVPFAGSHPVTPPGVFRLAGMLDAP